MKIFQRKIFTVKEITDHIKDKLESGMQDIWIEGEISNLREPSSGHKYFTLKDEFSQIRSVLFRYYTIPFALKEGLKIVVHGKISIYIPRGEYQIVVDYIEPKGRGALQLAFEQLKEKLKKDRLFDKTFKKPLPPFPKKIAIITSPTGAALHDMLTVIDRRFYAVHILIYPVTVQGDSSAEEIADAIKVINSIPDIDVIIVGRGGGSAEDLWAFNMEIVARAIFRSKIPIVSAVGHETDFTISDFVADVRAPTPSAAAEMVVQNRTDIILKVSMLRERANKAIKRNIETYLYKIYSISKRLDNFHPLTKISQFYQRIDELTISLEGIIASALDSKKGLLDKYIKGLEYFGPRGRIKIIRERLYSIKRELRHSIARHIVKKRNELSLNIKQLDSLSPMNVLSRGYSICTSVKTGNILKDSAMADIDDELLITLFKGRLFCVIKEVK